MDPAKDMPGESTCTSCQFSEDFSNYWTAILYFRARNGTYHRVPQLANSGFEGAAGGGMTVYYMQDPLYDVQQMSTVSAFRPVSQLRKCWDLLIHRDRDSACSLEISMPVVSMKQHAFVN